MNNDTAHIGPVTEKELLAKVAKGDERAFALLVGKYADTIYSHCLAYVKSVERAEELAQDIFFKIWSVRDKLPEVDRFEDYLFILARNTIYRSFRKKVQELVAITSEGMETDMVPDLQTEYRNSYQLLLRGIEQLPEKRRQVFRMSRLEGMSHEQISQVLGIHKVTVAQYIVKSLSYLKTYLKEHTGDTILVCILLRGGL